MLNKRVEKAYNNAAFLNSPDARVIRILSEFLEPARRFRHQGIKDTIVFFGSARVKSRSEALQFIKDLKTQARKKRRTSSVLQKKLAEAQTNLEMSAYYEDAVQLARLLTKWSKKRYRMNRFVVCSGGGPGIMEAANRGALSAGGKSIGLNISLPFEQTSNSYISDELSFEFHYFFMRKFWFVYLAKALVMFPGGFGTLDELMEVLTLLQTGKIKKKMTVLLYGERYWKEVLNLKLMVDRQVINLSDLSLVSYANSPKEAFKYLTGELEKNYPDAEMSS